jgi:hypothetical protein
MREIRRRTRVVGSFSGRAFRVDARHGSAAAYCRDEMGDKAISEYATFVGTGTNSG